MKRYTLLILTVLMLAPLLPLTELISENSNSESEFEKLIFYSSGNTPDINVGDQKSSTYNGVYGLSNTLFLFDNGSTIDIVDVMTGQVIDSENCSSTPRITAERNYVLCSEAIYQTSATGLNPIFNGPINQNARPSDNATVIFTGTQPSSSAPSDCFGTNGWGSIEIFSNTTLIASLQAKHYGSASYATTTIIQAILFEDTHEILLIYRLNDPNSYHCAPGVNHKYVIVNYSSTTSIEFGGGILTSTHLGYSSTCGQTPSLIEISYGAIWFDFGSCERSLSLASGAYQSSPSTNDYSVQTSSPACAIQGWDAGGPTGNFLSLSNEEIAIPKVPTYISCNTNRNSTILSNDGTWFTVWNDEDADGDNDLQDQFPYEASQWDDLDGDGYGDNPVGLSPDDCVTNPGKFHHYQPRMSGFRR